MTGTEAQRHWQAFLHLHSDNPREGPGDQASTLRALAAVAAAGAGEPVRSVLDLGCGPGAQTLHLLEALPDARFTAVDRNPPYIDTLEQRAAAAGFSGRLDARVGDMLEPPGSARFDLIWCEGAAYSVGVAQALTRWRDWLSPGGCVAFTEAVFLKDRADLPQAVIDNWAEYPAMTDISGVQGWVNAAGYDTLEHFVLPEAAWLAYYDPLARRVEALRPVYAGDPAALKAIEEGASEIAVYRQHNDCFGYAFFICRPQGAV